VLWNLRGPEWIRSARICLKSSPNEYQARWLDADTPLNDSEKVTAPGGSTHVVNQVPRMRSLGLTQYGMLGALYILVCAPPPVDGGVFDLADFRYDGNLASLCKPESQPRQVECQCSDGWNF
jgi:hypothetical protein